MDIAYFLCIGVVAGILGGLLGIGGGLCVVPLLTFIFINNGFPKDEIPRLAVGTSQALIIFISLSAVYRQYKQKMINIAHVLACLPAIIAGTTIGGIAILYAPALVLTGVFCIALVISMIVLFFSIRGQRAHAIQVKSVFIPITLISAISSSAGIGGGGLFTAFFAFIHRELRESIALSMSLVLPMSCVTSIYVLSGISTVPHTLGFIYYPALFAMLFPAIIGARIGVHLRDYVPQNALRKILASMLLASGVYIVYKAM